MRPSQKLRVLEEDIFSPPDQVPSRKTASSSGRTSLLPATDDDEWEGLDGESASHTDIQQTPLKNNKIYLIEHKGFFRRDMPNLL